MKIEETKTVNYIEEEIRALTTEITQEDYENIVMSIRNQEEIERNREDETQETERWKNRDNTIEEPLERSIWSPSNRECGNERMYAAKIPAYNVPGSSQEERTKFVKRLLVSNKHVKEVKETFKRGNA